MALGEHIISDEAMLSHIQHMEDTLTKRHLQHDINLERYYRKGKGKATHSGCTQSVIFSLSDKNPPLLPARSELETYEEKSNISPPSITTHKALTTIL